MSTIEPEVIVRQDGRAGRLTLNRPQQLNALTFPMVQRIREALVAWAKDPNVAVIIIDGAGEKAFCAGGDIVSLYESHPKGTDFAERFWADEYRLNAMIHRYPKPYVAVMDGIVMGGGVGLSAHARHRIVTEKSVIAMPETTIGLIPDVGGTWLLSHAQGKLGIYAGLTGYRMSGADAIQTGFADTYMPRADLPNLVSELSDPRGPAVLDILDRARDEHPVPMSMLAAKAELINRLFSGRTMNEIGAALLTTPDDLAQRALADLKQRSPLALSLTLEAIHKAQRLPSLEDALAVEYRLVNHLYQRGEFIEGIRALMIDKDKAPRWKPAKLDDVTPQLLQSYFDPLPSGREVTFDGTRL